MPRKKQALSKEEIELIFKIARRIDFLLIKQLLFGIANSITEKHLKDFDKTLEKTINKMNLPEETVSPNRYFTDDMSLSSEFFLTLYELLMRMAKNKNPAMRTLRWRAERLLRHLGGFSEMFPTAK